MNRREEDREAVADAAYEAWRCGRNYDAAWDRAQAAIDAKCPSDRYEAESVTLAAALRKPQQRQEDETEAQP